MTTEIRRAEVTDLATLKQLSITTFADTYGAYNTAEDLEDYYQATYNDARLTTELSSATTGYYLVYQDDQLAGYTKLNIDESQSEAKGPAYLEVERIYVLPAFKRLGIGRHLIEFAETRARELGKTRVWLGVWDQNDAAQKFYGRMAFRKTGEHVFKLGTDEQRDFMLEKKL
jgi:ribosomal protein S18 acetylase RimI-like enzyme